MAERESQNGDHEHEACRHEFFCFGEAHSEYDEKRGKEGVRKPFQCNYSSSAKAEGGGERGGHDEGNGTFGFNETDYAADDEQHDVNPQNFFRVHDLCARNLAAKDRKGHKEV